MDTPRSREMPPISPATMISVVLRQKTLSPSTNTANGMAPPGAAARDSPVRRLRKGAPTVAEGIGELPDDQSVRVGYRAHHPPAPGAFTALQQIGDVGDQQSRYRV